MSDDNTPADAQKTQSEPPADLEGLRRKLHELSAQLDEQRDELLRARAELDNQRKRMAREVERAQSFGLLSFIRALLPVKDSLEQGVAAATDGDDVDAGALREGAELTLRLCHEVLAAAGVEEIDPLGEAFDPERHEAMSVRAEADTPPKTVVEVHQKGYLLNGLLIRPARVTVSGSGG